MDITKNLAELEKRKKVYNAFGIIFSILCVLSVAAVLVLVFVVLEEVTIPFIIAFCVVPIALLIIALIFFKLASNCIMKIVVAKFVIADFEPTKLFILNKRKKRFLYLDTNKQLWVHANKTQISKIRKFSEIESYEIVNSEDIDYCFRLIIEVNLKSYEDPEKLVFFDRKINKDRMRYRIALDTLNNITKMLDKIMSRNQGITEPKEEVIFDPELNILRTELEKQKIRMEINGMQEKVCKYCGHKNGGNEIKCASCGAPLDDLPENE